MRAQTGEPPAVPDQTQHRTPGFVRSQPPRGANPSFHPHLLCAAILFFSTRKRRPLAGQGQGHSPFRLLKGGRRRRPPPPQTQRTRARSTRRRQGKPPPPPRPSSPARRHRFQDVNQHVCGLLHALGQCSNNRCPPESGEEPPELPRPRRPAGAEPEVLLFQEAGRLCGGHVQGEAGDPGRGRARIRGAGRRLHPGLGGDGGGGAALLVPGGGVLDLRGQDRGGRGGPVGRVVPGRRAAGGGLRADVRGLPQVGLRHPHPQGGRPVLGLSHLWRSRLC